MSGAANISLQRASRRPRAAAELGSLGRRKVPWYQMATCLGLAFVTASSNGIAAVADRPAPEGCHWQQIPELKATLVVPDGWTFRKVSDDANALLYAITPAGPKAPHDAKSRYELRVQKGVAKDSVVVRAKGFVEGILKDADKSDPVEEQVQGVMDLFAAVGYFNPDPAGVPRLTVAVAALANSRTGTLYTIRLDIPAAELEAILPFANALFRNVTVDDDI